MGADCNSAGLPTLAQYLLLVKAYLEAEKQKIYFK
jgi:hypothetical protein